MKNNRKWLFTIPLVCAVVFTAINPRPMYAIFGIGDIVFDPSSWASLGSIWGQDISNGAKLIQTYNESVKIVKNGLDMYNLANTMAQRVQNKEVWKMTAFAVGNEEMKDHYGETVNWSAAMNGDVLNAAHAYNQSTLTANGAGWMGAAPAANSRRMAQYATLQMLDQTSVRCTSILANYKATQDANQGAESNLTGDALDSSDAKNSMVAVLNVLSGGHIHMQTQQKANGNLQACLAEQQTLQAKLTRDRLAAEQNYYFDIAQARASESVQFDPNAAAAFVGGNYLEP